MSIMGLWLDKPKMLALKPLPGRVLVEIREKYTNVATTEQKYDTKTSGICIDFLLEAKDPEIIEYWTSKGLLRNKLVFWQEYKEGALIERDGKKYAFIKIEDLDGYEDVKSD